MSFKGVPIPIHTHGATKSAVTPTTMRYAIILSTFSLLPGDFPSPVFLCSPPGGPYLPAEVFFWFGNDPFSRILPLVASPPANYRQDLHQQIASGKGLLKCVNQKSRGKRLLQPLSHTLSILTIAYFGSLVKLGTLV